MDQVFSNYDILYIILNNLEIFNLNAISNVSKLFNKINNDIYHTKLKQTIIKPSNLMFKNYITNIQPIINLINIHNNENYYLLISDNDLYNLMTTMNDFLKSILNTSLWIALVNDFTLMENIFCHLANIDIFFKYIKEYNLNNFDTSLYDELNFNFNRIKKYLYVENSNFYKVDDLKLLCRFKNIKHYYKLKRLYLIKALTRPQNEIYFLNYQND